MRSGSSTFRAEPNTWSTQELVDWLQSHTDQEADALRQLSKASLVQRATELLDQLYFNYEPKFDCKFRTTDPAALFLWVANGGAAGGSRRNPPAAGSIEQDFGNMYNLSERLSYLGQELPMGKAPEDDLRQDLLAAAKVKLIAMSPIQMCLTQPLMNKHRFWLLIT